MSEVPDFSNAKWFPVDVHVPRDQYSFLLIDHDVLEQSTFLDTRISAELDRALQVPAAEIEVDGNLNPQVSWLFHTSFCCSTLLARLLHVPPHQVVLKEPLVLRRLADARYSRWPIDGFIKPTVSLLARPWDPSGAVVVKPTHAALNIGAELMAADAVSRGVILTSSLQDFLVSNLKKPPETLSKIPALIERALRASEFASRLSAASLRPPTLIAAAGLQWAAQRELCAGMISQVGPQRLKAVDASRLLDDVGLVTSRCAKWLGSSIPEAVLQARVSEVSGRNSKAVDHQYGAAQRSAEMRFIEGKFSTELLEARRWFDLMVAPAMSAESQVLGLAHL